LHPAYSGKPAEETRMEPLKVQRGEPPTGYSFVGLWTDKAGAHRWHAAAMKAKDTKPYMLTLKYGVYILWVKKRKGEGKMIGKGFKVK